MGSRMAANLLKNNKTLTVFNRSAAPIQELVAQGAVAADSYRNAVKNSAKEIYAAAKQDGLGRKDFSAIYQFMKNGSFP